MTRITAVKEICYQSTPGGGGGGWEKQLAVSKVEKCFLLFLILSKYTEKARQPCDHSARF